MTRRRPPWGIPGHPRINHGWRCSKQAPLAQTIRRGPDGTPIEISVCLECKRTDFDEQLKRHAERDRLDVQPNPQPEGPTAA